MLRAPPIARPSADPPTTSRGRWAPTYIRANGTNLVRDGARASAEMDHVGSHPAFSPGGARVAFVIRAGSKRSAVVDDLQGRSFDEIHELSIRFGADGAHFVYAAQEGDREFVVLDHTPGPPLDALPVAGRRWPGIFSSDGQHFAAVPIVGGKVRPWVDGRLGPELEQSGPPVFGEDGTVSVMGLRGNSVYRIGAALLP